MSDTSESKRGESKLSVRLASAVQEGGREPNPLLQVETLTLVMAQCGYVYTLLAKDKDILLDRMDFNTLLDLKQGCPVQF